MAHDEGANIADALRAVLSQHGPHVRDLSVLVVASGCTDDTVERSREVAALDPRIRILEQERREGKAAAVTAFIHEEPGADVLVLSGGDTRLEPGSLEALVAPFDDPSIGMTGGRPVPVNPKTDLLGRVVHMLWDLHHEVALRSPKLGELVAFRPVFPALPPETAVDEAYIESIIRSSGLRMIYVPEARVSMKGPCSIAEYLDQRRRIHAGHRHLRRTTGYAVSTLSVRRILATVWGKRRTGGTSVTTLATAAALEAGARLLGVWDDRIVRRDHRAWKRISSTKDLSS
jgi:cellulose synthase/poly-beta-1,6-N-acetylglucosamine synthase-like glycosyltransferase